MFNLLIRHDNAGLNNQYQNLLLPAISCFWQCSLSEAIALALLLSHTADDGSFQEDELNSTNGRRKKGSKYLERATVKGHLGYFKKMLYRYMQPCPGLVCDPEPKPQSELRAGDHLPLGKKHTAEKLLQPCVGSCKGPWGQALVLAPLLSITRALQQLVITCLIPHRVLQACTVALGACDTPRSPQHPPACPHVHSPLQEASRWVFLTASATVAAPAHPRVSNWKLHPPARQKQKQVDKYLTWEASLCLHCAYPLATRWCFFTSHQLRAEDGAKFITFPAPAWCLWLYLHWKNKPLENNLQN